MYTPDQVSKIKEAFWVRFGKYMSLVPGAAGEKINWINYKTGIRQVQFKMNATREEATIAIEINFKNEEMALQLFDQFEKIKDQFEDILAEKWEWDADFQNQYGQRVGRISCAKKGVSVLNENDWPAIISFLKPRIINLDLFWNNYRMIFEMIAG